VEFEWDANKAAENLRKHKVSFIEAATVFGAFLSTTAPDPAHSVGEHRFITVGLSNSGRLLMVAHAERGDRIRIISARTLTAKEKKPMKTQKNKMTDELRPEYDLRQLLKGGVRGKYAKRYHAGTNLVLLDPDVHKAFRSGRAVNDALRLVIELRKVGSSKQA
jgi:uncharacterized DUF497 family protein